MFSPTFRFGDVHFSLEVEVEHAVELLMYRLCGLSFLAAIIDSMQRYTTFRNKRISIKIKKQSVQLLLKLRKKSEGGRSIDSNRGVTDMTDWQKELMRISI